MASVEPATETNNIVIAVADDLPADIVSLIEAADSANLERAAQQALISVGQPEAQATILLTDDARIQELNRRYADVDAPTDVLSFSTWEGDPRFVTAPEMAAYLGDIVISVPYAARQAAAGGHTLDAELRLLVVHGMLHLLGYDHATSDEETVMWEKQRSILDDLTSP